VPPFILPVLSSICGITSEGWVILHWSVYAALVAGGIAFYRDA
jgi:hypothetical protein